MSSFWSIHSIQETEEKKPIYFLLWTMGGGRVGYQALRELCCVWLELECHKCLGQSGIWTSFNGELCRIHVLKKPRLSDIFSNFPEIFQPVWNLPYCLETFRSIKESSRRSENSAFSRLTRNVAGCPKIFQAVWKSYRLLRNFQASFLSRLLGNLPNCLKIFLNVQNISHTVRKSFRLSIEFQDCPGIFQTVWKSSRLSRNIQGSYYLKFLICNVLVCIFKASALWADAFIDLRFQFIYVSPFHGFFLGLSLALRSQDQFKASDWSTLLHYRTFQIALRPCYRGFFLSPNFLIPYSQNLDNAIMPSHFKPCPPISSRVQPFQEFFTHSIHFMSFSAFYSLF